MNISLSDHFTYSKLIRFVLPSIGMMIFTSIYGVVDGFFVSNFAGDIPFAAVNLIMPFLMFFSAIGFMIGSGGTALVSMRLGEGKEEEAKEIFSLLVYMVAILGFSAMAFSQFVLPNVARALGASDALFPYCVSYGRVVLLSLPFFMLQTMFQSFLVAAEKPDLGFKLTILAGVTNMVLDAFFVGYLRLGVVGAGSATAITETMGGVIPFVYFLLPNKSRLRLGRTRIVFSNISRACTNGASEFMTNVSMSLVNMLYNKQLLRFAGDNGVAAYGVIMYVSFIFAATFIGYSMGTAPIVGYNHGAENHKELHNVFTKSLRMVGICALSMCLAARLLAGFLAGIFVGYNAQLMDMTKKAFQIYSMSFLFMGFNIYASSFFTALNNGAVSAVISFLRTLFFQVIMVLLLPMLFGLKGVWSSVVVAEICSLMVSVLFWITMRKRYGY